MKVDATRNGFGKGLLELGRTNKRVVTLSADLTDSTRAGWFKKEFPERFFSFGVAEQDMISSAAGFALSGKIPFACTFGVFAAGRAWDQVRVSVDYMNLNVKIVGTHGGISVGEDGHTHQALEEITLMRVLPNMTVIVPCDSIEAKKAAIKSAEWNGPVYMRLGRSNSPMITKEDDEFQIGKGVVVGKGEDLTIVACGQMVYEALKARAILAEEKISARVINLHTLKPVDEKILIKAANETGAIITVEEHSVYGGLGGVVSEVVSQNSPVPVKIMGMSCCGQSGTPEELFSCFNLLAKDVAKCAKAILKKKKKR
ncbi:MAG: transketolase family protein [Candidatus Omnitrophica bacterium]|nr:transketolase family protein [Candidatus Omnitrophota bacterium]